MARQAEISSGYDQTVELAVLTVLVLLLQIWLFKQE
jgi:hypothetical protein